MFLELFKKSVKNKSEIVDDKDFFDEVAMPYFEKLRLQTASLENSRFVDLMTSALTELSVGNVKIKGDADRIAKGVAIVVSDAKNKEMTQTVKFFGDKSFLYMQ